MRTLLSEGETECLATAIAEATLVVASDDRRARAVALAVLGGGRVTGSLGLLRKCVETARMTAEEAFHRYTVMVEGGAFLPTITESFFAPSSVGAGQD